MSNHSPVEREIVGRAIEHDCPDCGASSDVRCRILTKTGGENPGYPVRTKVDVRRKPCAERVTLAWREWLAGQYPVKS